MSTQTISRYYCTCVIITSGEDVFLIAILKTSDAKGYEKNVISGLGREERARRNTWRLDVPSLICLPCSHNVYIARDVITVAMDSRPHRHHSIENQNFTIVFFNPSESYFYWSYTLSSFAQSVTENISCMQLNNVARISHERMKINSIPLNIYSRWLQSSDLHFIPRYRIAAAIECRPSHIGTERLRYLRIDFRIVCIIRVRVLHGLERIDAFDFTIHPLASNPIRFDNWMQYIHCIQSSSYCYIQVFSQHVCISCCIFIRRMYVTVLHSSSTDCSYAREFIAFSGGNCPKNETKKKRIVSLHSCLINVFIQMNKTQCARIYFMRAHSIVQYGNTCNTTDTMAAYSTSVSVCLLWCDVTDMQMFPFNSTCHCVSFSLLHYI